MQNNHTTLWVTIPDNNTRIPKWPQTSLIPARLNPQEIIKQVYRFPHDTAWSSEDVDLHCFQTMLNFCCLHSNMLRDDEDDGCWTIQRRRPPNTKNTVCRHSALPLDCSRYLPETMEWLSTSGLRCHWFRQRAVRQRTLERTQDALTQEMFVLWRQIIRLEFPWTQLNIGHNTLPSLVDSLRLKGSIFYTADIPVSHRTSITKQKLFVRNHCSMLFGW